MLNRNFNSDEGKKNNKIIFMCEMYFVRQQKFKRISNKLRDMNYNVLLTGEI